MNEKEKDALIQVKHFNNITRYWQEEEYEEKEIKKYITTILNLIEKQDKIIQAMAGEIAQFRNECDLENDTKETVIEKYEEQYIIWRKFFKESR